MRDVYHDPQADKTSHCLAEIRQSRDLDAETVLRLVHPRKCSVEGVKESKRKGCIDVETRHDRLCEEHVHWPDDGLSCEVFECFGTSSLWFRRPFDAETCGSAFEDGVFVRFGHAQRYCQNDGDPEQDDPLRPAPAELFCDEASDLDKKRGQHAAKYV